jgi:hypothetical protein
MQIFIAYMKYLPYTFPSKPHVAAGRRSEEWN